MKRQFKSIYSLTIASLKMYFRNFTGVFFTLFIPILLVIIFGLLAKSGGSGNIHLGITNLSHSELSTQFVQRVRDVSAFKVDELTASDARERLGKGKIDLQVVIPADFGEFSNMGPVPAKIKTYFNEGKPGTGQTGGLILGQIVNGLNNAVTRVPQALTLETTGVKTNNLGAIDFLLPGIIALTIMQLGIFSVAFAFISYKTTGALRRIQATPARPVNFIIAQAITRMLIGLLQVVILLGLGIAFFGFHLVGNIFDLMLMAIIGTLVFLAFGFAIAGWAKDENQAAPIANLVQFPMLFLSGTFFPRDGFPAWLQRVTDFFPLTYLADGMRRIANEGANLSQVGTDLIGLVVWGIIVFFIAIKVFRWE